MHLGRGGQKNPRGGQGMPGNDPRIVSLFPFFCRDVMECGIPVRGYRYGNAWLITGFVECVTSRS